MRQLPEQCASCERQIVTLETCALPDGTEKRGAEVAFRECRGRDTLPGVREGRRVSVGPSRRAGAGSPVRGAATRS